MTSNNSSESIPQGKLHELPDGLIDPCVHCGFCLPTCASYRVLGTEMDSPRGRIHTLKALGKGELAMDATIASHFDTCLGCFACVTACPSGVRYDQLIESTRPQLNKPGLRKPCQNVLRQLLLSILPYPARLRVILKAMRSYAGSSVQKIAQNFGLSNLFGPQLAAMEALLPPLSRECFIDDWPVINKTDGVRRGRVGLVLGCVQRCFDPNVNKATLKVLQANGFEVIIPANQGCCGAITHHQGKIPETQKLAKELIQSFKQVLEPNQLAGGEPLDAILIAASGCGHTMKAYGELLDEADVFDVPVLDVHEFLFEKGLSADFLKSLQPLNHENGDPAKEHSQFLLAYHDACHMIHGQGITNQPRKLLEAIPFINLREATEAGVCCGSAGIYNIVQPEEAAELGKIKVNDLMQTGAELIASANIGCSLQLRRHLNNQLPVAHPMEILARSAGLHKTPSIMK